MKYIKKLIWLTTLVVISVSCTDKYSCTLNPQKPEDVAFNEYLNSYDVLKSYIDKNTSSSFKLGAGITLTDFTNQEALYSLACTNFDEITPKDALLHGSVVTDDGNLNFNDVKTLFETAKKSNISVFGHTLIWNANQSTFLDNSIAPIYIPEQVIPPPPTDNFSGTDIVTNFDDINNFIGLVNNDGTPHGTGQYDIVPDPNGQKGNVIHIYGADGPDGAGAAQAFLKFKYTLPEGRKLGDYVNLKFDVYVVDNKGIYGQGILMDINGKRATNYNTYAVNGAQNNAWATISLPLSNLNLSASDKEATEITIIVANQTGAANIYVDNIIMDWQIIPSGTKVIADFEDNGTNFFTGLVQNPIDNPSLPEHTQAVAVVCDDPVRPGKALLIKGNADGAVCGVPTGTDNRANQAFFRFDVDISSEGKTLGDYKTLKFDVYINNNVSDGGGYGQGMVLRINDKTWQTSSGYNALGAQALQWFTISLSLADLGLDATEKQATSLTITFANRTGGANLFIDNVVMEWETTLGEPTIIPEQIIWKTDEEVKEILTNAMESWISGIMGASDGYVKDWEVVNEPMDDNAPTELKHDPNPPTDPKNWTKDQNFYWQDYLGKDYARLATKFARQYGGSDLKLFVNDYGLEANGNDKCKGLIQMINYWESDGVTKIDGIGTEMHVTYSMSPSTQKLNEDGIVEMFNLLKETGKLIRISALDMTFKDASGTAINTANLTLDQQTAMSEYYNFIVNKYFEIIPAEKRYGITLWNPVESSTQVGLWNSAFNRKITYPGFADGLSGK